MTTQLPWAFDPCSPEDATDPQGTPWAHAVRGRKPQRPPVMGYGHYPDDAERDATHKAHQADAREMLGERGEVIQPKCRNDFGVAMLEAQSAFNPIELVPLPRDFDMIELRREIAEWFSMPHRYIDGYGTISVMPWSADE